MSFVLKYNIYIKVQLLTLIFWGCAPSAPETNSYQADVIVYGGTSAGVIAAVEVAQSGKSVILVTPDKHLGGLTAGGLGWTDTGKKEAIGGLSRDFYHRVWKHYANEDAWVWQKKDEYGGRGQGTRAIDGSKRTMWIFEPHVAEKIFEDYIIENRIKVYKEEWLNRDNGVVKKDNKIISMTTLSGKTFKGTQKTFACGETARQSIESPNRDEAAPMKKTLKMKQPLLVATVLLIIFLPVAMPFVRAQPPREKWLLSGEVRTAYGYYAPTHGSVRLRMDDGSRHYFESRPLRKNHSCIGEFSGCSGSWKARTPSRGCIRVWKTPGTS